MKEGQMQLSNILREDKKYNSFIPNPEISLHLLSCSFWVQVLIACITSLLNMPLNDSSTKDFAADTLLARISTLIAP